MLQEAIDLQNRAVNELLTINKENKINPITFKAPTGSGKTFMMAKFMNEVLECDKDVVFLVSTLSKGNLAKQNYDKFKEYSKNLFKYLNPYLIEPNDNGEGNLFIENNHNVYVIQSGLLKKDKNKEKGKKSNATKLIKTGALENFFREMIRDICIENGIAVVGKAKRIYWIKDECHQETKNLKDYSKYFSKIFYFSATPSLEKNQIPNVEISSDEAIQAKLIKKIIKGNEYDSFDTALDKYEEIKEDYNNKLGVNPCLIVQISNEDKGLKEIKEIIKKIEKHPELKWMYIAGKGGVKQSLTNDRIAKTSLKIEKWRDYAKSNESTIHIIIFKMTISEGWDIPRACMLYQVRDTKSEQLDEQVIGRVRRNPRLIDFEKLDKESQDLAMKAWVWAKIKDEESTGQVVLKNYEKVNEEIAIKTTRIKTIRNKQNFNVSKIIKDKEYKIHYESIFDYYKKLKKQNNDINELCNDYANTFKNWFIFNDNIDMILKNYNDFEYDYESNMEIAKDETGKEVTVTLPKNSSYVRVKGKDLNLSTWVWENLDYNRKFYFDSDAEKEWADVLKDLSTYELKMNSNEKIIKTANILIENYEYLWGKNYLLNSEIKFEYYLNGKHFSYPDFIMKDSFDNIHIFEVKSINKAMNRPLMFDNEEYLKKISALKKCYKVASKLTGYIFYLPLLTGNTWHITWFKKGEEQKEITKLEDFRKLLQQNINT